MEGTQDQSSTRKTESREIARKRRAEENKRHAQASGINRHPCYDLHQASLKCLADNDYAHAACTSSFTAYKECLAAQVGSSSFPGVHFIAG